MTEQPIDPDAEYRARFGELEFQREVEEVAERLERNTRSLADVFTEYMEGGDKIDIAVGAHWWTGFVVDVGDDLVTIEIDESRVDVALGAVTLARVSSTTARGGRGHRTAHLRSFIARLRDLAGANAGVTVEIGGGALPTMTGQLRAVAESHVEMTTPSGELYVISVASIGFVSTSQ
jgi:hypothetical protein